MEKADGVKNIPPKLSSSSHHFSCSSHKEIKSSICTAVVFVHNQLKGDFLYRFRENPGDTYLRGFLPGAKTVMMAQERDAGCAGAANSTGKCVCKAGESNGRHC